MHVKIETSGTCEKGGMVQVRLAFYLDPGDYGYEVHHVTLPDTDGAEYGGKVDKLGNPIDMKDYEAWLDDMPTKEQTNPFHNHFIYVEPDATEKDILDRAEVLCKEAYEAWKRDKTPEIKNPKVAYPAQVVSARKAACDQKVRDLTATEIKRTIRTKDAK